MSGWLTTIGLIYHPNCRHGVGWISHSIDQQNKDQQSTLYKLRTRGKVCYVWLPYLSVGLSVRSYISKTTRPDLFCAYRLWPWLGPPLAALRYVMYFRFCGWRHVVTQWALWCVFQSGESVTAEINASISTNFFSTMKNSKYTLWVAHRRRSVISTIVSFWFGITSMHLNFFTPFPVGQ